MKINLTKEECMAMAKREGDHEVGAGFESCVPRRIDIRRMTHAERMILHAVQVVEEMGADVRLTDAVVRLQAARDCVADFVDGISREGGK